MKLLTILAGLMCCYTINAQQENLDNDYSSEAILENTSKNARLNRPYAFKSDGEQGSFTVGGYTEANTQYFQTEGEAEGLHLQLRNFNLFMQSSFSNDKISTIFNVGYNGISNKFELTEAALNVAFHPAFNLRAGVILPPIGYFNQNGDPPIANFVDGPVASTSIIPTRWSELGFGLNGSFKSNEDVALTYEIYAVNGLQNGIVDNDLPRTAIDLGKTDNVFSADNNSSLSYTGRVGILIDKFGEFGISYYTGQYNTTELDEVEIDKPRDISLTAVDAQIRLAKLSLKAEGVIARIDVYEGLGQIFGNEQIGYHVEASYPIIDNIRLFGNKNNRINASVRYEFADYNAGNFEQIGSSISDEVKCIRGGLSLQMSRKTMLKANYSYLLQSDILGNEAKTGGLQFGFATYL